MADNAISVNNSDDMFLEDFDTESQPVDSTPTTSRSRETSGEKTSQRNDDDFSHNNVPNFVQSVEDIVEPDTSESFTDRSDAQSKATIDTTSKYSSAAWTRSSQTQLSENASVLESVSGVNQMTTSYSTITEQSSSPDSRRKFKSLDVLKRGVPKLTVESDSVKSNDLLTPNNIADTNKTTKDQPRRDSSVSRVPTRMSQRSIDAKITYTTVNMPGDDKREVVAPEDSWIRLAIPYLPLWLAVTCLFLNMVIPGMGTIISGFCIFCCATSRVPAKYDQEPILLLCVNIWVGLAQLFTVTFLLVGWFWSLAWGIRMILLSIERRRELKAQRTREIQEMAVKAFSNKIGW